MFKKKIARKDEQMEIVLLLLSSVMIALVVQYLKPFLGFVVTFPQKEVKTPDLHSPSLSCSLGLSTDHRLQPHEGPAQTLRQ